MNEMNEKKEYHFEEDEIINSLKNYDEYFKKTKNERYTQRESLVVFNKIKRIEKKIFPLFSFLLIVLYTSLGVLLWLKNDYIYDSLVQRNLVLFMEVLFFVSNSFLYLFLMRKLFKKNGLFSNYDPNKRTIDYVKESIGHLVLGTLCFIISIVLGFLFFFVMLWLKIEMFIEEVWWNVFTFSYILGVSFFLDLVYLMIFSSLNFSTSKKNKEYLKTIEDTAYRKKMEEFLAVAEKFIALEKNKEIEDIGNNVKEARMIINNYFDLNLSAITYKKDNLSLKVKLTLRIDGQLFLKELRDHLRAYNVFIEMKYEISELENNSCELNLDGQIEYPSDFDYEFVIGLVKEFCQKKQALIQ